MDSTVIIMGKVVEKTWTDNIDELTKNNSSIHFVLAHEKETPKYFEKSIFKQYKSIVHSDYISNRLNKGDHIYLFDDNKNYSIEKVAHDPDGNILYFIDKVTSVIEDEEHLKEAKEKAVERVESWMTRKEEIERKEEEFLRERRKEQNEKEKSWWKKIFR